MPHQAPLQPGDPRRVGRYRLASRITGIPADGPIFLGTGPDGTEVTISMLRSDWAQDGAARDRFAAEAAAAKRVPPFCAARILDAGLEGGDAYLVSEYVPGRSLLEVISATGVLAEADLGPVAIGMATGLASVHHAGLVHGNFGPEFVIMTEAGPRVVEFGITPPYGAATPSADMLAWAQTVVFAAAGRPATAIADLDVLPEYLRRPVLDCLSPNPADRSSARTTVLMLIGDQDVPAGVLAEGSRRALPGTGTQMSAGHQVRAMPPARSGPARVSRPGTGPASGRPPVAAGSGQRPASRHSRAAEPRSAESRSPESRSAPEPSLPAGQPAGQQPRRAQPGRQDEQRDRPRARLRTGALAAAAVLVIAVIVVAAMQMLGGRSRSPQAAPPKDTSPISLRSPVASPQASPTVTPTTPAGFTGTWSGRVQQPPSDTYAVDLILRRGSGAGTVRYSITGVAPFSFTLIRYRPVRSTENARFGVSI